MNSTSCFDIKQFSKLDNPSRIRELRPHRMLATVAGFNTGMVGVDFGAGTGTFAILMATIAGAYGKVYAVDRSAEMLQHIRDKNPPKNLVLVQRRADATGLGSEIADLCLLAFILHELKSRKSLIAEAYRLLKPGGKLLIIEWKPELDSPGPPQKVRIQREQVEDLFKKIDIKLVNIKDWSRNHYMALGEKPL